MKRVSFILFSFIIFFSGSKNLLLLADYQLNRAYYETVCENKNRPAMQCHGKCQANKQSQNTSESYNFSSLIFTFINTAMPDIPLQDTTELGTVNVTSEISVKMWSQIFIGVPNPPPNT